jgi:hypothetical protein
MKKILIILFTLLNFSNSHHFGEQINITNPDGNENDWKDKETNIFSESKEMATCTCDLTSHCDIYCCCDEKCSDDDIKEWKEKSLCLNNNKKWVEDYMCKNGEETFNYNKEKAGINIKDQIFNIMCIRYDRSSDMVNYYLEYDEERDGQKIKALKSEWNEKFFGSTTSRRLEGEKYKYGQKINEDLILYKADSNGNCIKAYSYFFIPFEFSCYDLNNEVKGKIDNKVTKYNYEDEDKSIISEITNKITYDDSDNSIKEIKIKALYTPKTDSSSKIIKFKVQWTKGSKKSTKNCPPGYLQGNPIKISKENGETSYNNGYYFHIQDSSGQCIKNEENSFNSISILFKNNMFISCKCKLGKDPRNYLIYKIYKDIIDDKLKFYSAPNATESIKIINKTSLDFGKDDKIIGQNVKMNLIFLTSQKGKENSPYDIIQTVYLKMESEGNSDEPTISLNVNFVDFSFSHIENSKNNKITNSISLPQELLEKMSE